MNWQNVFAFLALICTISAFGGLMGIIELADDERPIKPALNWLIKSLILTAIFGSLAVGMK